MAGAHVCTIMTPPSGRARVAFSATCREIPPMARHTVVHVDISQWPHVGGAAGDRADMRAFLHLYGVYAHRSMDMTIGFISDSG